MTITKDEYLRILEHCIYTSTGEEQQECVDALFELTAILDAHQDK